MTRAGFGSLGMASVALAIGAPVLGGILGFVRLEALSSLLAG